MALLVIRPEVVGFISFATGLQENAIKHTDSRRIAFFIRDKYLN